MTATEIEYEQVYNRLKQRKSRQARDGKAHLLDNLKAKKGMRDLKEIGRLFAFMARGKREKDEEVLCGGISGARERSSKIYSPRNNQR